MCPEFEKLMNNAVASGTAVPEGTSERTFDDDSN
jgi:hypothetical protein